MDDGGEQSFVGVCVVVCAKYGVWCVGVPQSFEGLSHKDGGAVQVLLGASVCKFALR